MFAPTHAMKPLFDLEQRRRTPALFLITGPAMIAALGFPFDLRNHALDQIGCGEAAPQVLVNAEAVQRERFFEALFQAAGRRFIEARQFLTQLVQGAFRIGGSRRRDRPPTPRRPYARGTPSAAR